MRMRLYSKSIVFSVMIVGVCNDSDPNRNSALAANFLVEKRGNS